MTTTTNSKAKSSDKTLHQIEMEAIIDAKQQEWLQKPVEKEDKRSKETFIGNHNPKGRSERSEPGHLLEIEGNIVTNPKTGKNYVRNESRELEVRPCKCKNWFCESCCIGNGLGLRDKLLAVLKTFKSTMMWTFTIDPTLFDSPEQALKYFREKRVIAYVMQGIHRKGYLHSKRYFYVVEWQKNTEQAHFHVLVDATYVPKWLVQNLYDKYRPKHLPPPPIDRPGLGTVQFSAPSFKGPLHAARYACKYLIKQPDHGYPDWVLDATYQIRRYQTSQGFYKGTIYETLKKDELPEAEEEFDCVECEEEKEDQSKRTTIRERLANCKKHAVVIEHVRREYINGDVSYQRIFRMNLPQTYAEFLDHENIPAELDKVTISENDLCEYIDSLSFNPEHYEAIQRMIYGQTFIDTANQDGMTPEEFTKALRAISNEKLW